MNDIAQLATMVGLLATMITVVAKMGSLGKKVGEFTQLVGQLVDRLTALEKARENDRDKTIDRLMARERELLDKLDQAAHQEEGRPARRRSSS